MSSNPGSCSDIKIPLTNYVALHVHYYPQTICRGFVDAGAHLSFFFPLPSLWPESIFMLFPTVVGGQGDTTSPFWLALLCAF